MIQAIAHPTDFSPASQPAFVHALRLALESRCRLDLLHVRGPHDADHWQEFPHVREVLTEWGVLAAGATVADIEAETGVTVRKVEIQDADAVEGLSRFLISHRPDLMVMATHGRDGLHRWLAPGSVSGAVARETRVPALLFGPAARAFVAADTGALALATVLVPVARDPAPAHAVRMVERLTAGLGAALDVVHVGDDPPAITAPNGTPIAVRQLHGSTVEAILAEAEARHAGLIAMPTAGRHGFLDALIGSTTERIVAEAPVPVLAVPAL